MSQICMIAILFSLFVAVTPQCSPLTPDLVLNLNVTGGGACTYSGFAPLDPNNQSALFYWYVPNLNKNASAPVIVWLQGDQGFSSLWGFFAEGLGPYSLEEASDGSWSINYNVNSSSWVYPFNVLFIDNPVGVGYSYTKLQYTSTIDEVIFLSNL